MPKKSNSKNMQARKIALEAGAGVFTAAALAAGAAYLLSDKKRQVRAKAWVAKTRREVAANIKRARRMSETEYTRIVNAAVKRYGGLSDANKMELARVAMDLKGEWQRLQKIARAKTGTRSTAKKASGSRAAKKTRASRRAR